MRPFEHGRRAASSSVPPIPVRRALLAGACVGLFLAGCASQGRFPGAASGRDARTATGAQGNAQLPPEALEARYTLLGELHDNPAIHRLRLRWLMQLSAGRRVAVAMEQFDVAMQPQLDATRRRLQGTRAARELAEAGAFSFEGWQWELYEPVLDLVLERDLPLIAANLPGREAMGAAGGQEVDSRPTDWDSRDEALLATAISEGHCGLLPEAAVSRLVGAQLARDRTMAIAMRDAFRRHDMPVVLLAGNGHVRCDIGVPRHLAELDQGATILSIGMGEQGSALPGRYDRRVDLEPFARPDPCESLRKRFEKRPPAG